MPRSKILLADDHDLFREGLASLISAQPDLEVAGQAVDGLEAYAQAIELRPQLIVMDIKMPMCDGLEATRLIRSDWPEARILILSVHDEDEKLFEAIKSGASGYLLKNTNSEAFLADVRAALAGEAPLPSRLASRLLEEFVRLANQTPSESISIPPPELTGREREVLEYIAGGATDKEIAVKLMLSLHTVKTHVRNILSKLHAVNRRHAADVALREGWLKKKDARSTTKGGQN